MKKLAISLSVCALASIGGRPRAEEVVRHPVSFGTSLDFGQVVKGRFYEQVGPDSVGDGQVITRTGVYLSEGASYGNLDLRITFGGLFWSVLPEMRDEFEKRLVYFGGGIGQAKATYAFGGFEEPWGELSMGFFPIKYNPDAKNLGEYLYRSGTYPGVVYTGGWSFINSAAYLAQGVRFHLPTFQGKVSHSFTLTMERDMEPTYDFSPGYTLTWKPAAFFELGGGVVWAHGLPIRPDTVLSPRVAANMYDSRTGKPLIYDSTVSLDDLKNQPHYNSNDPGIVAATDPRLGTEIPGRPGEMYVTAEQNGVPGEYLEYYTFKGFKTMARASLDLGNLFGMDESAGPGAFKLYGEWAWLGVENQPYYYDKPAERMPVMLGVNIPTFRLLDVLGLEVEYRKSRFPNTFRTGFVEQLPLPTDAGGSTKVSDYDEDLAGYAEREKEYKKDDLKWSVYAKRTLRPGLSVHAQAASDHIRFVTTDGGGKFRPTYASTTREAGHWYYVLRLEFGI